MMLLHTDAVTENRTAGNGTRRVDRDHADSFPFGAQQRNHLIAECAFTGAGRSSDSQD
jgi:hypothetical protein